MSWIRQSSTINTWMGELEMLTYQFDVDAKVLERTRRLLTKAVDMDMMAGRKSSCVSLGCFYLACRLTGEYVPLNRVLGTPLGYGISRTRMTATVRTLIVRLQIEASAMKLGPNQYLAGILRLLRRDGDLSPGIEFDALSRHATQIMQTLDPQTHGGNPAILAAASVYLAAEKLGKQIAQHSLAEAAGSSQVALRNCVRTLRDALATEN